MGEGGWDKARTKAFQGKLAVSEEAVAKLEAFIIEQVSREDEVDHEESQGQRGKLHTCFPLLHASFGCMGIRQGYI